MDIRKTLFSGIMLLAILFSNDVFAHAVVTQSSLKIEPINAGQPRQISLVFNSKVELGLSNFFLVRKGDVHEKLVAHAGAKRGEVLLDMPSLESGEYALRIKVFAADGHLTEDIIRFMVVE